MEKCTNPECTAKSEHTHGNSTQGETQNVTSTPCPQGSLLSWLLMAQSLFSGLGSSFKCHHTVCVLLSGFLRTAVLQMFTGSATPPWVAGVRFHCWIGMVGKCFSLQTPFRLKIIADPGGPLFAWMTSTDTYCIRNCNSNI